MNEKEILQKIKESAESLTPPDSLRPEAIEQMLRTESSQENNPRPSSAVTDIARKKRFRRIAQLCSLAAVFALAFIVFAQSDRILRQNESAENMLESSGADSDRDSDPLTAASPDRDPGAGEGQADAAKANPGVSRMASPAEDSRTFEDIFTYADSYEAIYNALYKQFNQNTFLRSYGSYDGSFTSGDAEAGMGMEIAAEEDSVSYAAAADDAGGVEEIDFSRTNLQESGVDEGDIVKTDGTYIYILRQDAKLAILRADRGDAALVSLTALEDAEDATIREMYLDGDTLNIITDRYVSSLEAEDDVYYTNYGRQTVLRTYDVSDRSNPVSVGMVTQDGSYEDSRKNGPYIYLFTRYVPTIAETYGQSAVAPRINGTLAPARSIYLPESLRDSAYLVISSVDTGAPDEILDSKILVSGASNYYVSTENIYIANERFDYESDDAVTELIRFCYRDGQITGAASGTVRGRLNNSFSMNEYNGTLRVVSTYAAKSRDGIMTDRNALYVLDESLQRLGAIEELAEGETIRSARFFGDTGYFVTFRQTDPLFSVDLSDPANPKVLGELKISGFSSYLHFYGRDLLLGIGYEADEETGVTSGLKLSMFDISDPADVREVNRLVIPGITWCPAIEEYKSILVSPEKNLIGFFCDDRYMVFSYDDRDGFRRELLYDFYADMLTDQAEYYSMRGLYISDTLYLAGDSFLISFDMAQAFEKLSVFDIDAAADARSNAPQ